MTTVDAAPRLVLRAYRGPEDHPAMQAVAAQVRRANQEREIGTVADMDNQYRARDQAALPFDCVVVELDTRVVAYGRASWSELASGGAQVESILNVAPSVRGIGIEDRLIDHATRRAETLAGDPERTRGRAVYLRVFVSGSDQVQRPLLEARGFRVAEHGAQLIRPDFDGVPDLPVPAPFEVRPIDPDDRAMHRRVWEAGNRAFAQTRGVETPTEAKWEAFRNDPLFAPHLWQVAFDGDTIAGQILNYLEPEADGRVIGWTEAISVQPEYRRRGLARALLARSIRVVRDAGATCAGLGVDLNNPNHAADLYQEMGYRIISEAFSYDLGPLGGREDWEARR
jgi:ribosomal protein S18 acetylase RimI-like enzyme